MSAKHTENLGRRNNNQFPPNRIARTQSDNVAYGQFQKDMYEIASADISNVRVTKDESGHSFAVYLISVVMKTEKSWVVEKRYKEFRALRHEINHVAPELRPLPFPRKKMLFNFASSTLKHRQELLGQYLTTLVAHRSPNTNNGTPHLQEINIFLEVIDHIGPSKFSRKLSNPEERRSLSAMSSRGRDVGVSVKDFKLVKVLGQGSFGKVYLVRPLAGDSNEVYAMKILRKSEVSKRHQVEHTRTERKIMAEILHPYILRMRYSFQTQSQLFMVTDFCAGGELFFHLKRLRRFSEGMVRFYSAQISVALAHLHQHNILYRDLKPENILLDRQGNCKLTDFGLSKICKGAVDRAGTFCGTPEYLSPEMICHRKHGTGYGKEIDWWSLGIVAFELLTGWPPFYDREFSKMCEKILTHPIRFPSKYQFTAEAQAFIKGLLLKDPTRRLGCGSSGYAQFKAHVFFCGSGGGHSYWNWDDLESGRFTPPFKPPLGKSADDTRNFDTDFTKLAVEQPSDDEGSTEGSGLFPGFSFVDPTIFATADHVPSSAQEHSSSSGRSTSTGALPQSSGAANFASRSAGGSPRYGETDSDTSYDDSPFRVSQRSSPANSSPQSTASPKRTANSSSAQSPRTLAKALSSLMSPKSTRSSSAAGAGIADENQK